MWMALFFFFTTLRPFLVQVFVYVPSQFILPPKGLTTFCAVPLPAGKLGRFLFFSSSPRFYPLVYRTGLAHTSPPPFALFFSFYYSLFKQTRAPPGRLTEGNLTVGIDETNSSFISLYQRTLYLNSTMHRIKCTVLPLLQFDLFRVSTPPVYSRECRVVARIKRVSLCRNTHLLTRG